MNESSKTTLKFSRRSINTLSWIFSIIFDVGNSVGCGSPTPFKLIHINVINDRADVS